MAMKLQGSSARSIAATLGRAPSTITRELRRNGFKSDAELGTMGRPRIAGGYDAVRAGVRSRRVRRQARRRCKLHFEGALWRKVRALLVLCAAVVAAGTVTAWLAGRAAAGRDVVLAVKEDW